MTKNLLKFRHFLSEPFSTFVVFLILMLLFFASLGCQPMTPVFTSPTYPIASSDTYSYEVDRTIQAWNNQMDLYEFYVEDYGYNGDATNPTTCNKNYLKFAFINDIEFLSLSLVCALPPEGQSCQEYWNSQANASGLTCNRGCAYAFYRRSDQTIYISERVQTYTHSDMIINELIRHETIHWLSTCSGHEDSNPAYENSDAAHADPRLWSTGPFSVLTQSGMLIFNH